MSNEYTDSKQHVLEQLEAYSNTYEEAGDPTSALILNIAADIIERESPTDEPSHNISKTTVASQVDVYGYGCAELELTVDNRLAALIDTNYLDARVNSFGETIANDLYRRKRTVNR